MKHTSIFLFSLLCLCLVSIEFISVNALNDYTLQLQTTTETESRNYELDYENGTKYQNYQDNMYGREGMINFNAFPYTNNIKPYIYEDTTTSIFSNISIINVTDYSSSLGNFTTKGINFYQNTYVSNKYPKLFFMPFTHTMDWNVNFSFIFSTNENFIDVYFYVYCGSNYLIFSIYRDDSTLNYIRVGIFNQTNWQYSSFSILNKNYPYFVKCSVNDANLAEMSINSLFDFSTIVYVSRLLITPISYASYYFLRLTKSTLSYRIVNLTLIAFDSTHFVHYQNPSSGGYNIAQFDPDYTPNRILNTYQVSQKSYGTFDYPNLINPYHNCTESGNNATFSFNSVGVDYKQLDGYVNKNRVVNALNITFTETYSNITLENPLPIFDYNDFFYCLAVQHPGNAYLDIAIEFGVFKFGVVSTLSGWEVYREWNASRVYMNYITIASYMEIEEEIVIGVGIASPTITSSSFFVRSGRRICYFNQSATLCNFSIYNPTIRVRNYNAGSSGIGSFIVKGIFINDVDFSFSPGSSTALYFTAETQRIKGNYSDSIVHDFTYPTSALYDYYHKIIYLNSSYDIVYPEYYYGYFRMVTSNETFYLLIENEVEKCYGQDLWGYGQYDNFSISINEVFQNYGYDGAIFQYTITFVIRWYYYEQIEDPSLFSTIFQMIVPSAFLIVFPYVFKQRFGAKGAVVGLMLGFVVMGASSYIPFTLSIVLCVCSTILAILVWKLKDKDSYNLRGNE